MLERTVRAPKPREAMFEEAAAQVRLELTPDEARQPCGAVLASRESEERRKMGGNSLVEHRVLGFATLVRRPPMAPRTHGPAGEHRACRAEASRRILAGTNTYRILLRSVWTGPCQQTDTG